MAARNVVRLLRYYGGHDVRLVSYFVRLYALRTCVVHALTAVGGHPTREKDSAPYRATASDGVFRVV